MARTANTICFLLLPFGSALGFDFVLPACVARDADCVVFDRIHSMFSFSCLAESEDKRGNQDAAEGEKGEDAHGSGQQSQQVIW